MMNSSLESSTALAPWEIYHRNLLKTPKALKYLRDRKISLATARQLGIGYFPPSNFSKYGDRVVFPVRDLYGDVVTFQGRALFDWAAIAQPKYWHESFDKSRVLCGLYENGAEIVRQGFTVLHEGPFDIAALLQCGVPSVTPLGARISDYHAFLLRQFTDTVIEWFDGDKAGVAGATSAAAQLKSYGFCVKRVPEGLPDPSDLLVRYGKREILKVINEAKRF